MQVTKPSSDTSIIIETQLSPTVSSNFLDMAVHTPLGEQEPCLIYNSCGYCQAADGTCADKKAGFEKNTTLLQNTTRFGATVDYECSLGKEFKSLGGGTQSKTSMTCQWDGTWSPTDELQDCKCECQLKKLFSM